MSYHDVGQLAQTLFNGYMAYCGSREVIRHPARDVVLAVLRAENRGPAAVPAGHIFRKDGTEAVYHLTHAVEVIAGSPEYEGTYDRLWLAGALLTLGDALAADDYLDHGPDLEFVRHLRNGIAHGNRFNLKPGEPRCPAHFTGPSSLVLPDGVTRVPPPYFEIDASLNGREVLFDFLGPGDVWDILQFVSARLISIANGGAVRLLYPQRP